MPAKDPQKVLNHFYNRLKEMEETNASDLYLTVGCAPNIRINDEISLAKGEVFDEEMMWIVLNKILSPKQMQQFQSELELNFPIILPNGARFRANLFQQQEQPGLVIRRINVQIPTLEALDLPNIYADMVMRKQGLIILASPSGSGKSTSLAAMLDHRNRNGKGHILTIEDPIEFLHNNVNCIFTQREVGVDTHSFENALTNALRQKADVIVVGEIRTKEAMIQALRFAEAGHLCLSTLHANSAAQAIKRMVSFFPDDMKDHAHLSLSQNLLAIFSQKLLSSEKKGRVMAIEVLKNTGLIRNHISEGKFCEINSIMERVSDPSIRTMDTALFDLYKTGDISKEVALHEAENPSNLRLKMSQKLGSIQPKTDTHNQF